jgi:hypothetical protein
MTMHMLAAQFGREAHLESVRDMGFQRFQPMRANAKPRLSHHPKNPSSKRSAHLRSPRIHAHPNTASGELGFRSWNDSFTLKVASMGWKPVSRMSRTLRRSSSRSLTIKGMM